MPTNFSLLKIKKIIAHEVFPPFDGNETPAALSDDLIILDPEGLNEMQDRLTNVLGKESKSTPMDILNTDSKSCFSFSQQCINGDFVLNSKEIAQKHTNIHTNKGWPGGLIIVIEATITSAKIPCIFIIKAEKQSGFNKTQNQNNKSIVLKFLNNLFLTPQSKLYKVGVFIFDKSGEHAVLFDSNLSSSTNAAQYFYQAFLGLKIPATNKSYTKQFFDFTTQFIQEMEISTEEKIEYQQALYNELKVNKNNDFQASDFAKKTFTDSQKNDFLDFLDDKSFPTHAIQKDISLLTKQLKVRRLKFSSEVRISAPLDKFDEFVKIIESNDEETTVRIKGRLDNQTGK